MNVVSFGTGVPPLVLVGGWIGPWQIWRQTIEILSIERRCIAYDHRGAGQTVTAADELSFDAMVDDVFAVMDHLGVERCWLGGESQGGTVACAAAIRDPSRFHGQVLIGTGSEIPFDQPQQRFAASLDSEDPDPALRMFVDLVLPEPDADHYKRWLRSMLDEAAPGVGAELLRSLGGTSISDRLSEVRIPTLVIHGSDDRVMALDGAGALVAGISGAELCVLDGAGHVPTITRPEEVASIITEFIARKS